MNIKIKNLLRYTNAQQYSQIFAGTYICFIVSGVEYMRVTAPDGENSFDVQNGTLLLLPKGTGVDFKMNEKRFNFSSACEVAGLAYKHGKMKNILRCPDGVFELPMALQIENERMEHIFNLFECAEKFAKSPLAKDRIAAEMLMSAVLAEFVEKSESDVSRSVSDTVSNLKRMIDKDLNFEMTVADFAAEMNCSEGHLRRLFKEFYQINISEYRAGLRLAKIRELMVDHTLNMKEIADLAGMKNVTHLHKFIQTQCSMTPKQLRKTLGR